MYCIMSREFQSEEGYIVEGRCVAVGVDCAVVRAIFPKFRREQNIIVMCIMPAYVKRIRVRAQQHIVHSAGYKMLDVTQCAETLYPCLLEAEIRPRG